MSTLALQHPQLLWILLVLLLFPWGLVRSLVEATRRRRALQVTLRGLVFACLTLAVAQPLWLRARDRVSTVILVDASDSISDAQLERARKFVSEARATRSGEDELHAVLFARRTALVDLGGTGALPPFERATVDPTASDLEAALQFGLGLHSAGTMRRLVLMSDGNENEGNAIVAAQAARAARVQLDVVPLEREEAAEVVALSLRVPPSAKVGAPFEVRLEILSTSKQRASVSLYRDEILNAFEGRKEVELEAGQTVVTWKSEALAAGPVRFRAVIGGSGGARLQDRHADNNEAHATLSAEGRPQVLYVEGEPGSAHYLANALRRENIDVDVRGATALPTQAADLERYDLAIVSDLPIAQIGSAHAATLEKYLREAQGTLLLAAGVECSDGYFGSAIERLLPVRFETEKKREQAQLALALVIDRSGSMSGEKMELAKDAAKATAELLSGEDLLSVIAFDDQPSRVVHLQRAANRARISADIARLRPGGGTKILPALREAFEQLAPAQAKVKHVILLTDGLAGYDGIRELVEEMSAQRITISAVGVGSGADRTLLTMIAERGGGRFYFTQDAQNIPKIFTKETKQVSRSSIIDEAVRPRVVKNADFLRGLAVERAPALRGYVATKMKSEGELLLSTQTGDPLLARWRVGLGQSAFFSSDVKNRWAAAWLAWPAYGKFWAQFVRAHMRHRAGSGLPSYELVANAQGSAVQVTVDAISRADQFVTGLQTTLKVLDPQSGSVLRSEPMSEAASGRYAANFHLDRPGAYLLRAEHMSGGRVVAESAGSVTVPFALEHAALQTDRMRLEQLVRIGQGRLAPTPAQVFARTGERPVAEIPLWPYLVWVAAVLLVLDVAARRDR